MRFVIKREVVFKFRRRDVIYIDLECFIGGSVEYLKLGIGGVFLEIFW